MSSDERLSPWKVSSFKPGMFVLCKVSHSESGGYTVIISEDDLTAFLPSVEILQTDEEVKAQFVCVYNNRILLSSRYSRTLPPDSGSDQQGSPVPKEPMPSTGVGAICLPLPEEQK